MISPPSWLDPDKAYLVGISGGRDSVFLHHWLKSHQFHSLIYCHLNHGLRGEESNADQVFLEDLLGKQLICEFIDVACLAKTKKISFEVAARQARHDFFDRCSKATGITEVLLAHHEDDQAETLLLNLLRGSAGLKAMKPFTAIGSIQLLRPMLQIRRSEIDLYLQSHDLPFREDSTNALPITPRNRLRHEILPLLQEIMGRDPVPALLRAEEHFQVSEEILNETLHHLQLSDPQGRLFLPKLREFSQELQKKVLFLYLKKHQIPDLSSLLIGKAAELIPSEGPPALSLPGGLRLRRKESRLFISP